MSRFFSTAAALSLLAVLTIATACGGDPEVSSPTGIAEVDAILSAIEADDAPALIPFLAFNDMPCERYGPDEIHPPAGIGILCREGESTGELVPTSWGGSCEGSWWGRSDAESLSDFIVRMNVDLYAVYEVSDDRTVPAQYVAIFATNDSYTDPGFGLYLNEGQITGTEGNCGAAPAGLVEYLRLDDAILSPQSTPP